MAGHFYYVYVLESLVDSSWYIGFTPNNPEARLEKHNALQVNYSKRKAPWKIIYFEAYIHKSDATGREKFLKSGSGHRYIRKQIRNYLEIAQMSEGKQNLTS
jgi:putative endonuclease